VNGSSSFGAGFGVTGFGVMDWDVAGREVSAWAGAATAGGGATTTGGGVAAIVGGADEAGVRAVGACRSAAGGGVVLAVAVPGLVWARGVLAGGAAGALAGTAAKLG
jgi:hypothetical protein